MKKIILTLLAIFQVFLVLAQGGIGVGTNYPDNHAVLDIQSTTKGILIPRMTSIQRLSIDVGSSNGMLVYDINTISFWYYGDGDWQEIKSDANREWYKFQDSLLWSAKSIGIGNFSVNPAAVLDIQSTSKGILIPRVSTTQRNAMSSYAVDGLLVFDADEIRFFYYTPAGWTGIGDFQQPYWLPTWNSSISSANTQNIGIGTQLSSRAPQYKLDIEGRIRIRQSNQGEAGIWLDSVSGSNPASYIGVINNNTTGIWGQSASGWGLAQNNQSLNVGIGTTSPSSSAILELNSTSKAFLPPALNDYEQIKAIGNPQAGMVVYDKGAKSLRVYDGFKWVRLNRKEEPMQSSGINSNAAGNTYFGGNENEGLRVAEDASGNVYVAGVYSTAHIGFGLTATTTFGVQDIFLVKFNSAGALLWARSIGSEYNDTLTAMEVSIDGNIYLSGQFSGTCNFGGNFLTANLANDGFLSKWDASGNQVWTISFGGSMADYRDLAEDMTIDNSGNIYVTGSFAGVFNTSVSGVNMTSYGLYDAFVIKISPSGNLQWMRHSGGNRNDYGYYIEADQAGNLFTFGTAGGSVLAGSHSFYVRAPRNRRFRVVLRGTRRRRGITRRLNRGRFRYIPNQNRVFTRSSVIDYLVAYNATTGTENSLVKKYYVEDIKSTTEGYYEVSQNMITRYNATSVPQGRITMNKSVQMARKSLHVAANNDIIILANAEVGAAINFTSIAPDAGGWVMLRLSATGNLIWSNQLQSTGKFNVNSLWGNSSGTTFYYTGDFTGSMLLNNGTVSSSTNNMFVIKYQQ